MPATSIEVVDIIIQWALSLKHFIGEANYTLEKKIAHIEFVNTVAIKNVHMAIDNLRAMSPVLKEMEDNGEIKVVGAMYHVENGQVHFL